MADWNDLCAYVRSNYKITSEKEGFINLLFETDDLRSQRVFITKSGSIQDSEWADIVTVVGKTSDLDPAQALVRNWNMKIGFFAHLDDSLCFVHRFPLLDLQSSELDAPLRLVARFGDQLEKEFTGKDLH